MRKSDGDTSDHTTIFDSLVNKQISEDKSPFPRAEYALEGTDKTGAEEVARGRNAD